MVARLIDGFDVYLNVSDVMKSGYVRQNANAGFNSSGGRYGGGALTFGITDAQGWLVPCRFIPGDTMIVCFAYFHSGTTSMGSMIETSCFNLELTASGVLQLRNQGNSIIATSSSVVTQGVWHWVEAKVTLGTDNTNGSAEIRVDGTPVISVTNVDFFNTSATVITALRMMGAVGGSGATKLLDDLIIMDGTGSTMNDFIGDSRIETLLPNADGAVVAWTPSSGDAYECVDDALGAVNDDADYIESATPGQEARFAFENLSGTPVSIPAVQVRLRARKDDAGDRTVRGLINSNNAEAIGPTLGLSTDWSWLRGAIFYVDPDTSNPWDATMVNALQAGVEVVS